MQKRQVAKIPENVEMFPPLSELLKLMEEAQIQATASNTVQEDAAPSASDNVSPVDPAHEDAVKADSDAESAAQKGSVPTEVTTNVSESETSSQTPAQSNDAAPGICPSPASSTAEDERFEKPTIVKFDGFSGSY